MLLFVELNHYSLRISIKTNSNRKYKALSYSHVEKVEKQLKAEVKALTVQAETADQASVNEGMNIPEEIARREERLKVLAAAKETIEARAQERFEHEQAEYQQKTDKREAQKKAGQKPRGSEPKPPQPRPKAKDQVNLTDEESRIMPVSGGGFEQCYNAQASVDTDTMLVVSEHMSQAPNDKKEIEPALKKLWSLPQELGAAEDFLANTGYVTKYSIGERSYTLKDIHHRRCFIETIFIPSI